MRPVILCTPRGDELHTNAVYYDNATYFSFLQASGGLPILCGILNDKEAEEAAENFDGLLITGGGDVNPELYHETNQGAEDPYLIYDENDIRLYHAFRKAGRPVLGICRGIQLIGVAEGVKLIQDLPSQGYRVHDQKHFVPPLGKDDEAHSVHFLPGTRLYDIFGDEGRVNTFHHQAIASVPKGFTLDGVSDDNVIEAMEKENVLAVQWHPERLYSRDQKHKAIGELFIHDCLLGKTR